jgi:hypothetical protein
MKTLLLLFLPLFCFAQSETESFLAVINDKDGFTFVREKADKNSKIVDTIYTNEIFPCQRLEKDWYEIYHSSSGYYIHKSRVKAISTMSLSEQKALVEYRFNKQYENLKDYQKELDLFEKGKSTPAKIDAKRKIRRDFIEKYYLYCQEVFKDYYCKTADSTTLKICFKTILADKGNNTQSNSDIFLAFMCRNAEMAAILSTYSDENREYLLRFIECGYERFTYGEKVDKTKAEIAAIDKPYLPYLKQLKTGFKRIKIKGKESFCSTYSE